MPSRHELIEAVESTGCGFAKETVDALLTRWPHIAGPRVIDAVEELDALPPRTLLGRIPLDSTVFQTSDVRGSLDSMHGNRCFWHEDRAAHLPLQTLFIPNCEEAK